MGMFDLCSCFAKTRERGAGAPEASTPAYQACLAHGYGWLSQRDPKQGSNREPLQGPNREPLKGSNREHIGKIPKTLKLVTV